MLSEYQKEITKRCLALVSQAGRKYLNKPEWEYII
ncbi:unnamed protein product, partial [marine sediment metagenome]